MIAETLAGIALVKSSVEFIKGHIDTAKDIGEIAGAIDGLFRGHDEAQQARNKKSNATGLGAQFGVDTVAKEIIDAKLAAEQLAETARLVDFRFGHGTWASILAERQKRIQEQRELEAAAKRKRIQEHNELMEMVQGLAIGFVIFLVALTGVFVAWKVYSS
jgi:hypothetical protein